MNKLTVLISATVSAVSMCTLAITPNVCDREGGTHGAKLINRMLSLVVLICTVLPASSAWAQGQPHTIEYVKRSFIEMALVTHLDLEDSDASVIGGDDALDLLDEYFPNGLIDGDELDEALSDQLGASGYNCALLTLDDGDMYLYLPLEGDLATEFSNDRYIVGLVFNAVPNHPPQYDVGFVFNPSVGFCSGCAKMDEDLGCFDCNAYSYPSSGYDDRLISTMGHYTLPGWGGF